MKQEAYIISYYKTGKSWKWYTKLMIKAVQLWTRSKYFHTEIIIGDRRITSHTEHGVIVTKNLNNEYSHAHADIKKTLVDTDKINYAIKFAERQVGKGYDWKGIFFSQVIPMDIDNKDKWFCNEISGQVLKMAGAVGIEKDPNEYNPGSFQKLF